MRALQNTPKSSWARSHKGNSMGGAMMPRFTSFTSTFDEMPVMGADQFVGNFAYCNARYRSLDFCFYLFQPFFDMGEACSPRFDGNIGQVDVHRIARQILHEQIDCRAAVNCKTSSVEIIGMMRSNSRTRSLYS